MELLEEQAARWHQAEALTGKETAELESEIGALREMVGDPLQSLDRRAAYETRRLQDELSFAEGRVEDGLQALRDLGISPDWKREPGAEPLSLLERAEEMLTYLEDGAILPVESAPRAMRVARPGHAEEVQVLGRLLDADSDMLHVLLVSEERLKNRGAISTSSWTSSQGTAAIVGARGGAGKPLGARGRECARAPGSRAFAVGHRACRRRAHGAASSRSSRA
jgi:hypothetical protein